MPLWREKVHTRWCAFEEEIKEARGRKKLEVNDMENVISSQKIDLVSQAEAESR